MPTPSSAARPTLAGVSIGIRESVNKLTAGIGQAKLAYTTGERHFTFTVPIPAGDMSHVFDVMVSAHEHFHPLPRCRMTAPRSITSVRVCVFRRKASQAMVWRSGASRRPHLSAPPFNTV